MRGVTNGRAELAQSAIETPIGRVQVVASARGICRMEFAEKFRPVRAGHAAPQDVKQAQGHADLAARQILEYFDGKRREFDLPLDLRGTEIQLRVWKQLLEIPFGKTLTYAELARRSGIPAAARAAGAACGANPVWLVVPCHRVIGSDGGLHGYGGGLWRKKALLELEGSVRTLFK